MYYITQCIKISNTCPYVNKLIKYVYSHYLIPTYVAIKSL